MANIEFTWPPEPSTDIRRLLDHINLLHAALTKAVSLPMGQLPSERGRYYSQLINGNVVVTPEGK